MPIPAIVGAIATQAAGTAIQGGMQSIFNNQQHRRNLDYYNIQRKDALSDWQRDAAYNHPAQMAARLREGGFSPHLVTGQSALTSAPQTRSSSMGNAPAAYQVNGSTNMVQMRLGLAQLESIRLQNEKTKAETANVQADTQQKGLVHSVDAETLRSRRFGEIWQAEAQLRDINVSIQVKQQTAENMKAQLLGVLNDNKLKEIDLLHRNTMLQGQANLVRAQERNIMANSRKIEAEIESIRTHTNHDIQMFPSHMKRLEREIENLRQQNTKGAMEEYYLPDNLRNQRDRNQYQTEMDKNQLEFLQTLPPEARYAIERMGGKEAVQQLLSYMKLHKILKR